MILTTDIFLFFFLPVFVGAYHLTPVRYRNFVLLGESYIFYAWWRLDFTLILLGMTAWTYAIGRLLRKTKHEDGQKLVTAVGVIGCLAVLGFFKYFNFFIDSLAGIVGSTPEELGVHWRILFPIGISFYVFHAISYIVDIRKGRAPAASLVQVSTFLALFPQIVAGPVLRWRDLAPQLTKDRPSDIDMFLQGCLRFVLGMACKVVLADNIAPIPDQLYALDHPTFVESWLAAGAFSMQIYFDFAGYSAMAIGLGMMFGLKFPENFRTPFHSRSVTEFWQRWHMSLGVWLYTYVFNPLGGSRRGSAVQYRNIITVSFLIGLWHGASVMFVVWGLFKACILVSERMMGWIKKDRSVWYGVAGTVILMIISAVMFRSPDVATGISLWAGMVGLNGFSMRLETAVVISLESVLMLVAGITFTVLEPRIQKWGDYDIAARAPAAIAANWSKSLLGLFLVVVSMIEVADNIYHPFIYAQF